MRFDKRINQDEMVKIQSKQETMRWLYQSVNDICNHCDISPNYEIRETFQMTYSEKITSPPDDIDIPSKGIIHLAIWDEQHGRVHDRNILIYSVLREISQILSPGPEYDDIEAQLLNMAIDLKYYNPDFLI